MAGKEYTAKDKIFSKMTREGLTEETLRDGSVKKISQKSRDETITVRVGESLGKCSHQRILQLFYLLWQVVRRADSQRCISDCKPYHCC